MDRRPGVGECRPDCRPYGFYRPDWPDWSYGCGFYCYWPYGAYRAYWGGFYGNWAYGSDWPDRADRPYWRDWANGCGVYGYWSDRTDRAAGDTWG